MSTQTIATSLNNELSKKLVLFTLLLGIFMGALDHGIVGPALSSINGYFDISTSWEVWSFTVYTLLFAVSIPVMGKMSDRYGRKNIFTTGISLFAIGSLLSAPNFTFFLMGRAVQAIGTGGIFPITAAQIAASYSPEVRGKYLGYIGVVFGLGSILGPVAGGAILSVVDWQWIFFINILISLIVLFMISRVKIEQVVVRKPIDFKGIFILTFTILSFMLGVTLENVLLIILGAIFAATMVIVERKAGDPILNMNYFLKRNTLFILLLSMTSGFIMATTINLLPLFSETILGLGKGEAGFGVTPLAVSSMVASMVGGVLVDKIGAKKVLLIGFFITVLGALFLAFFVETVILFILTALLMGFGIGIIIGAPLNVMMMQNIQLAETGAAVGNISLFRSMGSTIGPTVGGIILTLFNNDFTVIYLVSVILATISILLIARMKQALS